MSTNSEDQLRLNDPNTSTLEHLDEVFDVIPLDYLGYLVEIGVIDTLTADEIKALYERVEFITAELSWREEDELIRKDGGVIQGMRRKAAELLSRISQR